VTGPRCVLHVETGTNLYGGALQVLYLMRGLRHHGVRSLLACPRGSEIAAAADGADEVYPMPMSGDVDLRFVPPLRRLIREQRPDIIHLHSRRGADVLGAIAARGSGVPVVLSRRVDNREIGWWAHIKYRMYDRVITVSDNIREVLLSSGVPADKLVCVPSAVDADAYGGDCDRSWFREQFALADDALTLAVVAQLIPRKGHRHLLRALPQILAAVPQTRLLVFGKGPLASTLKAQCEQLGVGHAVHFTGFRDDMTRILRCVDVLVHPAELEGLGVALLQAGAASVPAVASRAGGIPEIVRDGINGYLVEPGDSDALEQRIVQLLRDPGLRQRMGDAGREIARREFSIEAMVSGNLAVYRQLCTT